MTSPSVPDSVSSQPTTQLLRPGARFAKELGKAGIAVVNTEAPADLGRLRRSSIGLSGSEAFFDTVSFDVGTKSAVQRLDAPVALRARNG